MIRVSLLLSGCLLLLLQQYVLPISIQTQFVIFLAGIFLLGVPHGAADLLVASQNANSSKKDFSTFRFFILYLGRLCIFASVLYFFPVLGNLLFIFFAAYHFGETDLYQFKTNTLIGKLFVISYGLVILSVILLHHFEEVKPLFLQFPSGQQNSDFLNWIDIHRYTILSASGILFFTSTFLYFLLYPTSNNIANDYFLIRFAILLILLFNLPMLLGFTFYFVVWHSFLSLNNIVQYLRDQNRFSVNIIVKQIIFYSVLAIAGIGLFGFTGFMFINSSATMGYVFLGLAVLTAPHMQIMHEMYCSIRGSLQTQP